jgi:hypothetical protein
MNKNVQKRPPKFRPGLLFWLGLTVLAGGCGPLIVTGLLANLGVTEDPNPNPVGFGILAFFTFYPSIAMLFGGLILAYFRYRAAKKRFYNQ